MPNPLSSLFGKKLPIAGLVLVLAGVGYKVADPFAAKEPLRYVVASASRQTLVSSVAASGQVSGENQLDLKPTVSGQIKAVSVKPGQTVSTSTVLFTIDPKEAQKTVRDAAQAVNDARLSLESSQISLQKLRLPPDAVALTQARHSVDQARRALDDLRAGPDQADVQQAQQDYFIQQQKVQLSADGKTPNLLRDAYDDAVPTARSASQTVQTALRNLDELLRVVGQSNLNGSYEYSRLVSVMNPNQTGGNLYEGVQTSAQALKRQADALRATGEDPANIDAALRSGRTALDLLAPLLQQAETLTQALVPSSALTQATIDSLKSSVRSDRSDVASKGTSVTSAIQALDQAKTDLQAQRLTVEKALLNLQKVQRGAEPNEIATAEERLAEAQASLAKLQQGASALDLATAQNGIEQRRSSLLSAQQRLADAQEQLKAYTIYAPFEGVLATVPVRVGDQASPSTVLGSLLTKAKIATVSLNEVDVSKIQVGQKATLTFDALPDLQIAGSVSQIDTLGTVSQGVVSYAVKVAFLTEDARVKPGMSVALSIITDVRPDVLAVPNGAIQQAGGQPTVQVLAAAAANASGNAAQGIPSEVPPEVRSIQVGFANDQFTEIVGGLEAGEQVVVRTIDPNVTTASTGAAGGSGAAVRIPGLTGGAGQGGGAVFRGGAAPR